MEEDVEEVLLESYNIFIVGCARNFRSIVTRLQEEAGNSDNKSHGDDDGVWGERALWLLGGASVEASVGDSKGLSVEASVGRSLGRERRWDVGRFILVAAGRSLGQNLGRRQCGSIGRGLGWSEPQIITASVRRSFFLSETAWVARRRDVGQRALIENGVGTSVGLWSATVWVERRWYVGWYGKPWSCTALGRWLVFVW